MSYVRIVPSRPIYNFINTCMKLIKVRDTYMLMHWATSKEIETMYGLCIEAEHIDRLKDRLLKKFPNATRSEIALEIIKKIV